MVLLYFAMVLYILGAHYTEVPKYLSLIFTDAFSASFYKGDAFLGGIVGGLMELVRHPWRMVLPKQTNLFVKAW